MDSASNFKPQIPFHVLERQLEATIDFFEWRSVRNIDTTGVAEQSGFTRRAFKRGQYPPVCSPDIRTMLHDTMQTSSLKLHIQVLQDLG